MTGKVVLVLFVLCTLGFANHISIDSPSREVTLDDLVRSTWKFYNDNGLLGTIKFERDGTVSGYQNPNEAYWKFDGGFLHILNEESVVSCKFVNTIMDHFGKWHLNGRFLLEDIAPIGWEHYLIQD